MFNDIRSALCVLAVGSAVFGILLAYELFAYRLSADRLILGPQ